jgi:uncharacterized protein YjbI with pentapeptide repeats
MNIKSKNIIVLPQQQLYKSQDFSDSIIKGQKFLYNQFDNCNLTDTLIIDCDLAYCSILNSFVKDLVFKNCDLTGTRIYNTEKYILTFENCDLSSIYIEAVENNNIYLNCFKYSSGYKLPNERIEL